ncbi:ABC transporter permease [Methylomarinum sp. Ch1-1]|uniref:ABC transporter permease n=1 Tax=Methylomarinum roseum TaxID=3067653 RepID=A0AAU7NVP6_9GAMM|nr:ABC transporter permease [Methylomarinum sp. Ch1-1]MDP4522891.1 ABC transporter permease [Methylomarinum sp. Ch1-1]
MAVNGAIDKRVVTGDVGLTAVDDATMAIRFSGSWVQGAEIKPVEQVLSELTQAPLPRTLVLQAEALEQWDSRLPTYLLKITDFCRARHIEVDSSGLPEGVRSLLQLARAVPEKAKSAGTSRKSLVVKIGNLVLTALTDGRELLMFVGNMVLAIWSLLRGKARFRAVDMGLCIQDAGPAALGIVTLISLLVGMILAFVGAVQLAMFGAQIYIADLVGLGTVREMGALMTAVIVTGRTGAAYAAQLGAMNVNNEIDALKTMGISPMEFLVMPRMLALILMMPLLCLYADLIGMLGGALVTVSIFDVSLVQYYNETGRAVDLTDFFIGLSKSLVFAVLIATAGCMRGLQSGRSASDVGDATTKAVVNSIVYIVVADSVITLLCNHLDI